MGRIKQHPARQLYIEWLCTPKALKDPPNEAQFCSVHKVTKGTLHRWKNDSTFRAEWDKRMHELELDPDNLGEVLRGMRVAAANGNVAAAKEWARIYHEFRPPTPEPEVDRSLSELSDAELDDLLSEAVADERTRRSGDVAA